MAASQQLNHTPDEMMKKVDVVIAGGGFAGLTCAKTLARKGLDVVLLERKQVAQQGTHTTGILVKEVVADLNLPDHLVRKITNVRLYSPALKSLDIQSPDYFFMATDTPEMMAHLSDQAMNAGAEVRYDQPYISAQRGGKTVILPEYDLECDFLIGADGPRSKVAKDFNLGRNQDFLLGAEVEFSQASLPDPDTFYCFLDVVRAYGYLGWVIPSVDVVQVGLATKMPTRPDMDQFIDRIGPLFGLDKENIVGRRGGRIPAGGMVKPFADDNVILVGDAAGMVSPLTAGGIHTAINYGELLGEGICNHKRGGIHPVQLLEQNQPRFQIKQMMRWCFEHLAYNWMLDLAINNGIFQWFSKKIFFKQGGINLQVQHKGN